MNTIDSNKPTISFGIAFRNYKNSNRVKTGDLLDATQELEMYKKISKKLKTEKFIKTKYGIQSANMKLENDTYVANSNSLRYNDATGNYFFADTKMSIKGLSDAFKNLRKDFEALFNKK